jgi:type IV pilus assembly protein PilY1
MNMKTSINLRRLLTLGVGACVVSLATAQQLVDLTQSPVASAGRGPAANLLLSLSVEFPTVGAAYRKSYADTGRTLGYWDADSCYTYVTAGAPAVLALPASVAAQNVQTGFFRRSGAATNFQCSGAYSGNFLNWVAQSAVDSLRYALTGGDRIVDTPTQTILMRADLPSDFYRNASFAPSKSISVDTNKYTPFSGTIHIANCRNVIYIGTQATGSCDAPGNNGNRAALRAAVEVCSAAEGPLRPDLCTLQPSGSYKPTGLMQQYADRIRFAAFGYPLDSGNQRYGGVLRAPMKFVGKNAYNASFAQIANTAPEWHPTTGVFYTDPLNKANGSSILRSGVANYLNSFGRMTKTGINLSNTTGATSAVLYKGNDPVSELYYEGLRYLQGQQPTPAAAASLTAAMYDGFPIYTTWAQSGSTAEVPDPITSSCQANSIIQIADAYTHNDKTIPGNTRTNGSGDSARGVGSGEPNVVDWTDAVGVFEGISGLGSAAGGCCDASHYIAGLSYWAHTKPIRADKPNVRVKTYVINVDENGDGTIRNRERTQQLYYAAKYGGFTDTNNDGNPFSLPPDGSPAVTKWASGVDDDGRPLPKTFFLASSPQKMVNALRAAFASIASSSGTLAGGSVSSTRISTSGSLAYTTRVDAENDAATVLATRLTLDSSNVSITVAGAPDWNAADKLTGIAPLVPARSPASRRIFSTKSDATPIEYLWTNLDSTQQALYNTDPDTGLVDGLGARRVNYIRGVRTDEAANGTPTSPLPFRNRKSLVASIVNSAPIFVGSRPSLTSSGEGFTDFVRNTTRKAAVYVGTNNGVLHAFDALTGDELFAFIPRVFVNEMPKVASPNFATKPMIDVPPTITEARMSSGSGASAWKTVLVAGYGGGAQGAFALDVTRPESFGTSNVMWNFSDADDPKMGNVTGEIRVLKFKTAAGTFRWFAVVPSGYNNSKVDSPPLDPVRYDPSNTRSLFLLAVDKSPTASWSLGSNYYRIDLPTGFSDSSITTALSTPGDQLGVNSEVLRLYAGDTQGNLWKFDFGLVPTPFANNTAIQGVVAGFGGAAKPLFTAIRGSDRQPITIPPIVGDIGRGENMILFGTGKFLETADTNSANFKQQSMYGIWDDLTNTSASRVSAISRLEPRTATVSGSSLSISGADLVFGTSASQKQGWYFDFPDVTSGERQVTNLALASNYLYFNTTATVPPTTTNSCGAYGGRQCAVNAVTGLSFGTTCAFDGSGFLPSPIVLQPQNPNAVTETSGQGIAIKTDAPLIVTLTGATNNTSVVGGASNASATVTKGVATRAQRGRLSWREIVDFEKIKRVP